MRTQKWYNYTAKIICFIISIPIFPILCLISMASGGTPLEIYKVAWKD